jgi:hypothetical protein
MSRSIVDTLLESNTIGAISESSGANKNQVKQTLESALPTLIQSMKNNASTEVGHKSLSEALSNHSKADISDITSFIKNVDIEDGSKIITHVLGENKGTVEKGISKKVGLKSDQIATILSTAAPLLLNLLGKKKKEDDGKEDSGGILGTLASALLGQNDNSGKDNNSLGSVIINGIGSLLGGSKEEKKPAAKKKTSSKKKTGTTAKKKKSSKKK